jgi:hypothetical protein
MKTATEYIGVAGEYWWRKAFRGRRPELAPNIEAQRQPVWQLDLYPFTQAVLGEIAHRAAGGDLIASAVIRHVLALPEEELQPNREDRFSCLTCDYDFTMKRPPFYLTVLAAHGDKNNQAQVSGICNHCVRRLGGDQGVQKGAFEAYRRKLTATYRPDDVSRSGEHDSALWEPDSARRSICGAIHSWRKRSRQTLTMFSKRQTHNLLTAGFRCLTSGRVLLPWCRGP